MNHKQFLTEWSDHYFARVCNKSHPKWSDSGCGKCAACLADKDTSIPFTLFHERRMRNKELSDHVKKFWLENSAKSLSGAVDADVLRIASRGK